MTQTTDRIERKILLRAPRARVWRALSNAEEFGNWFGVKLQGKTFAPGQRTHGQITYPGYEHIVFEVWVERVEPERIEEARRSLELIEQQWDHALGKLKRAVEGTP